MLKISLLKFGKYLATFMVVLVILGVAKTAHAQVILFQNDNFATVESNSLIIDNDNANTGNIIIQFGQSLAKTLLYNQTLSHFEFNANVDLTNNQLTTFRVENVTAMPGGASGLGSGGTGRTVQLTATDSIAPGCTSPSCTAGTYAWNGTIWEPLQSTITTSTATKIVTVGPSGRDYTTVAAAAAYLNTLSGGEMWVDPGTYSVTTSVNLSNITIRGSDPSLTTISILSGGQLQVINSKFYNLTINVDSGITAAMGLNVTYNSSFSSDLQFTQVNFTIGGTKLGIDSTASTAPVTVSTFNQCGESGTGTLFNTVSSAGISSSSTITVSGLLNSNSLQLSNWPVTVVKGSNVVTSGTLSAVPGNVIDVSPGMNIQDAITSLGSSGGIVRLAAGTYTVTSSLSITNSNIEIQGQGSSTIVQTTSGGWTGTTTAHDALIQVGASNGTAPVNNVIIDNFQLQVGADTHGIEVNGGTGNKVTNMNVVSIGTKTTTHTGIVFTDGSSTAGSRFTATNNIVDRDVAADRWIDGIHFDGGAPITGTFGYGNGITDSIVSNNIVNEDQETSFDLTYTTAVALTSNHARNAGFTSGAFGFYLNNCSYDLVMDNTLEGNNNTATIGIELASTVVSTEVIGNSVRGNPSNFTTGINIADSTSSSDYVQENDITNASTNITDNGTNSNKRLPIGTASAPTTVLDLNGDLALRTTSLSLASGTNNNVSIGSFSNYRITGPTAAFTITGLSGGVNGKILTLFNTTTYAMTVSNANASSLAANRILTMLGKDLYLSGNSHVTLIYDSTLSEWIVQNSAGVSSGTYTAANGSANNIVIPISQYVYVSGPTAAFTFTGITAEIPGQMVTLYNSTGQTMTLSNQSASSTAANRIITLTGANLTITGPGSVTLIYDTTSSRWIVISSQ